jgi:hypothetical protein
MPQNASSEETGSETVLATKPSRPLRAETTLSRTLAQRKTSIAPAKSFDKYNLILNNRSSEFIDRRTKINASAEVRNILSLKAVSDAGFYCPSQRASDDSDRLGVSVPKMAWRFTVCRRRDRRRRRGGAG